MQKEIEAEGVKEKAAYDKFMCYCNGNTDSMKSSIEETKQFAEESASKLEQLKAEKAQLDQDLVEHKSSRQAATADLEAATNLRAKDAKDAAEQEADMKTNVDAMTKAIAALEKGMGSFMQLGNANMDILKTALERSNSVDDMEKQTVLDFMQQGTSQDYAPASGQIVGILKAMKDETSSDLKAAIEAEEKAVSDFGALKAAKQSEIAAATSAIEEKTARAGELAVEVVQTADAVEDAQKEAGETAKFLEDLGAQCAAKTAEWDERQKMRAEEVAAISEAITILNDDDALDIFKKTASLSQESVAFGFMQKRTSSSPILRARHIFTSLAQTGSHTVEMNLLAAALKGKADFSKITKMIDDMVTLLGKEQEDDDSSKKLCNEELAQSAEDKEDAEDKLAGLTTSIDDMSQTIETLTQELKTLADEIKTLDQAVADATKQREDEHAAFTTTQAENQAALQLLEKAKNRLYKVYRPSLYKEAEKRELTEEEKIIVANGGPDPRDTEPKEMIAGTNIPVFAQVRASNSAAPPPPPETFGAYQKKGQKSNGVLALMDMMIEDMKKDRSEQEYAEKTAQKDYETLMSQSQKTREDKSASITEKEDSKATWGEKLEAAKAESASTKDSLMTIGQVIQGLHTQCDFLLQHFDARKEARTNEIEGLKNAKAVLAGANFS